MAPGSGGLAERMTPAALKIAVKRIVYTCLQRRHLLRTGSIALVVGTWLTLFNQADILLVEGIGSSMMIKIVFNYATPFTVANLGLLSRHRSS